MLESKDVNYFYLTVIFAATLLDEEDVHNKQVLVVVQSRGESDLKLGTWSPNQKQSELELWDTSFFFFLPLHLSKSAAFTKLLLQRFLNQVLCSHTLSLSLSLL